MTTAYRATRAIHAGLYELSQRNSGTMYTARTSLKDGHIFELAGERMEGGAKTGAMVAAEVLHALRARATRRGTASG